VDLKGLDEPSTTVISDASQLNEALTLVLARLWNRPALLVRHSDADAVAADGIEARLELAQEPNRKADVEVRIAVTGITNRALCDRIRDWNRLRDVLPTNLPVDFKEEEPPEGRERWVNYSLRGSDYYVIKATLGESSEASVYRCVRALPPRVVFAAAVFPSSEYSLLSLPIHSAVLPETHSDWLALGFIGPMKGLGAALGLSHELRFGIGSSSWADTANIRSASVSGTVPYEVDETSVYVGVNWAFHYDLSSRWSLNARPIVLLRFNDTDTSGVPSSLAAFSSRSGSSLFDFSLAFLGDIAFRIRRDLSVGLTGLFSFPQLGTILASDALKRTVYFDPTYLQLGIGAGINYSWQP
jgi:hypothetical protein